MNQVKAEMAISITEVMDSGFESKRELMEGAISLYDQFMRDDYSTALDILETEIEEGDGSEIETLMEYCDTLRKWQKGE